MKSNPNAMMFRNGLLATAMMSLTLSAGARADEKPGTASVAATWVVADPGASVRWLEDIDGRFEDDLSWSEDDQAGGEDEWTDSEGDPADFDDSWVDLEDGGEWDSEDGWEDSDDGMAGGEEDWSDFEDGPVDTGEGWEGSWEYEDYLAEFGEGVPYPGEYYELFRAFAAGGTPAIPGGWETVDRFSAKVKAVARFAVRKQNHLPSASNSEIELGRVLYARQQVVSGVNYSVRLEVKHEGLTKIARAKVWFRPGSEKPQLLKWSWLPSVNKVKR